MFTLRDIDIFYLSYDEPQAEEHYRTICDRISRPIKRVHGVKGFDKAHKKCAEQANSWRFATIDGDNLIVPEVLDHVLDDTGYPDVVFSFKGHNAVNGLEYGNGGIKVWPRALVLRHDTHESAVGNVAATDFCWTYRYMQVDVVGSTVHPNGSPYQAFRSGYREGVKMSLLEGHRPESFETFLNRAYRGNLSRLFVWTSVGADVEHGWWVMFGARLGLKHFWLDGISSDLVSDYDWFADLFRSVASVNPHMEAVAVGRTLNEALGAGIVDLDADQSRWFKRVYVNPPRSGLMLPHMAEVSLDG